jgi:anti-anti-sigma factor
MRVSADRKTRPKRLAHLSAHTSPTTMVLPSLVINVRPHNGLMTKETKETKETGVTVEMRGELDALTADPSADFLLSLLDEHPPTMVLDLSKLTFCDACGLSTFVRLANRAEAAGGSVTLSGALPMLAKQLYVTGLDRRFLDGSATTVRSMRRHLTPDP